MSMPLAHRVTADEVRAMPVDGNRYETIHGELLVTPAPGGRHQHVVMRLIRALDPYLMAHGLEAVLTAPADISFDGETLVQPDLFVGEFAAFLSSGEWADVRRLYLVIEVLSPATARADRTVKRRLYQEQRIEEYWIVDPAQHQVEVWTPEATFPRIEREEFTWRHPLLNDACRIDVGRVTMR
jgi:Uma2 family endonuclease